MKQILLLLAFLFGNNFAFAENKLLRERYFAFVDGVQVLKFKIVGSEKPFFKLPIWDDDLFYVIVELCETPLSLSIDTNLALNPRCQKSGGTIRTFPQVSSTNRSLVITLTLDHPHSDRGYVSFQKIENEKISLKFPNAEGKTNFEKDLAERRKQYCPPVISRRIP